MYHWMISLPPGAAMEHDIALLRLAAPVTLNNNIKVATLAEEGQSFLGQECVLAGWGMTSTGGAFCIVVILIIKQ